MTEYARLVISVDSTSAKRATDDLRDLDRQSSKTERAAGGLVAAFKPLAGIFATLKIGQVIKDTVLLSSRYNELGIVMEVVGKNAGYSRNQLDSLETKLRETGIAAVESRSTIAKMVTANIDLAKATDLARLAQDAAVIGGLNSSDAFERLIRGIQTAEVETLRNIGLNVNFEQSYQALATQLGKTTNNLTELEKTQARTNAVLGAAPNVAGAYEAAMENAGKQIRSASRLVQDLATELGQIGQPAFEAGVSAYNSALKGMEKNIDGVVQTLETGLYVVLARGGSVIATNTAALVAQAAQQAKNNALAAESAGFELRKAEATKLAALADLDKARTAEASAIATLAQVRANQQLFSLQVALSKGTAEYAALSKSLVVVNRELALSEQAVATATASRAAAATTAAVASGNLAKATAVSTAANTASAASSSLAAGALRGVLGVGGRLLGLLGGPVGLAFTIGAVALSFVDFSSGAETAKKSSDQLEGSVSRLGTAAERAQKQFAGLTADLQSMNKGEIEARAERIQKLLTRQQQDLARNQRLFDAGNKGITSGLLDKIKANIDVLESQLAAVGGATAAQYADSTEEGQKYLARLGEQKALLGAITEEERARAQIREGLIKVSAEEEKAILARAREIDLYKAAEDAAMESARAAEQAADTRRRSSEELLSLFANTAASMEKELALYGTTSEAARLRYELEKGSLRDLAPAQKLHLQNLQDELDARQSINEIQNINLELLRATGQERAARDLQFELDYAERIAEYERQGNVEAIQRLETLKLIREINGQPEPGTVEGVTRAPGSDLGGLNTTGFGTDLERLDQQAQELEDWRQQELERQKAYLDAKEISEEAHAERVANIYEQNRERLQGIEQARQDVMFSAGESFFGDMAEIAKAYAGEQSGIYRALFATSKAFAIADGLVQIGGGIAKAANNPWPVNLAAMATVAAAGVGVIANIQSVSAGFQQGGYTGNGGVSDVAGVVHGKEFVFDADATARIGVQNLEAMRRGQPAANAPAMGSAGNTYNNYNMTSRPVFTPGMTDSEMRRSSSAAARSAANQLRAMQRYN